MRLASRLTLASTCACLGVLLPGVGPRTSLAVQPRLQLVAGKIELPTVMAADPHGNVYVAVYGRCGLCDSIVKLSPDGRVVERREFAFGSRPGQFKTITGLAADSAGNIYATDYLNNRIQKLSPTGVPLAAWRGNRGGGPGLSHPQGLTLDSRDNLYVVDSNAGRVVKLAPDGRVLAALSTGYTSEYGSAFPSALIGISGFFGNLISALLAGVVVDSRGNVLVATGDDLRKLSPSGVPLAIWKPPAGKGYRQQPQQVAVDRLGNIYTSGGATPVQQSPGGGFFSINFEKVDKLSPTGKLLARFGKRGNAPGRFGAPVGLALDAAGNLYVAELANNRVQKLSPSGRPLAIRGDLRTSPPPHGRFGSVIYGFAVGPRARCL